MATPGVRTAVGREEAEERFERLYAEHGRAVLAYALRRLTDPHDAADVVAETFLVAWRRLDDVPASDAARLWLYRVARYVLANQYRSERRRERLAERLRRDLSLALEDVPRPAWDSGTLRDALAGLGAEDQEILRLCGWEELTPRQIATVLGITHVAARSRLHRARRRLRASLGPEPEPDAESEDTNALRLQEAR
jgi:RNA polymerase sigma-70 factor (ECF subfamily)